MAYELHLYERLTHKYNPGWSHLDRHEYAGTVKVLGGRTTYLAADYDEGDTWLYRVVAPRTLKGTDLTQALRDSMGGSSCQHEYDCCGCASRHASVKRINPRAYSVRVSTTYNY
jgi:hypothetical protein